MAEDIASYEKLGAFYLGRPFDLQRREASPTPLLYDSRHLLTHAVPTRFVRDAKGALSGIEIAGPNPSAAPETVRCDLAVIAIGQSKMHAIAKQFPGVGLDARGCIVVTIKVIVCPLALPISVSAVRLPRLAASSCSTSEPANSVRLTEVEIRSVPWPASSITASPPSDT